MNTYFGKQVLFFYVPADLLTSHSPTATSSDNWFQPVLTVVSTDQSEYLCGECDRPCYYHRTLGTADLGIDLFITKSVYMYMRALSINGFRLKITKGLVLYCISTVCVFNIFNDTETLLQNYYFYHL